MAGNIKGITIEIGGNTQPLEKALGDVNKKTRDLQGELKSVERLLKLDPGNTELLAQKQKLLAEQVENSAEKLNRLKAAQEQVNQAFQRGDLGEEQYRHFSRQVINAEQDLKKFENQLKDVNTAAKKAGLDIQGLGEKLKGTGQSLSLGVTAPIVGGFLAITEGTKELRGDLATLATNASVAGQDMGILNEAMAKLHAVTGETDSNVEGLSELLATGFRDEQLTELLNSLYGASIKFKDTLKFEGIADGLQETLATGAAIGPFGELLERSGIQLDGFNAGLKDAIKNGTEEQYILDVLAKTGLAETYEAYRKNNEEMVKAEEANFKMQQAMAQLGATLAPILTPIIEAVTRLVNKFNELSPVGQKIGLAFAGIAAAIGPVLVVLGSAMNVIGPLVTAIGGIGTAAGGAGAAATGMGAALSAVAAPIAAVVAAIALVVAAIKDLWQNNEGFRTAVTDAWNRIKESINDVVAKVKEGLDKISAWWQAWGPSIMAIINPIWEGIKAIIGTAVEIILNMISLFLDILTGDWEGVWQDIHGIVAAVWDGIKGIVQAGADFLMGIWNLIVTVARGRWDELKTNTSDTWNAIKDSITGAWTTIANNTLDNWNTIKTFLSNTWKEIYKWAEEKWTNFKTMFLNIWGAITGGVKGYINNIIGFINRLIDALNTIQVDIPEWVPGYGGQRFGINLPHVPALAKGTNFVPADMLAYLHKGEAVIPKEYNQPGPSIGQINIYGNNADEIWYKFERELQRRGVKF